MKPFKAFLMDGGYDLGLQDHLYVKENSWGKERNVDVFKLVDAFAKDYQDEINRLQKELSELRAEFILREEDYNNLQEQMHEERSEMHNYIKELRQYED
jgi:hypothetical protein